ncbi:hypothetical protein PRUPE_7G202400 [Prunus persica]|uniref:thermospermine synthase n=1 Tax=Prunus persica TaxID=3760 RepID=A0A251NH25_PRUPE|nr:hypothetical protein PRUPE_7G202400 [Prunus persica]
MGRQDQAQVKQKWDPHAHLRKNKKEEDHFSEFELIPEEDNYQNPPTGNDQQQHAEWFEEQLEADLKWSFALNGVLHAATSEFQDIVLLDTKRFGKALVIDGKLQSAERDEFIYHECLVHPALLLHDNPKTIFIMGGGEGSTARESLKHKDVEKVIMCDIDRMVVDFCREHLTENQEAFRDDKLHIVFNDAKAELEKTEEKFDVIVGDLPDPIEGGPCNDLYTKPFYEQVIKPHLKDNGIFVTQAGLAGILSHKDIFTSIYNTIKHVFKYVIAYTAHVPSYADSCGWVLASDEPLKLDVEQLNSRIQERIRGDLLYLDGASIVSSTVVNKMICTSLLKETQVLTGENVRFVYGHGLTKNAEE